MTVRYKVVLHYLALILIVLIAYSCFFPPPSPKKFGTNSSVRFYLTKSLVLDRSFSIEKYYSGGIDSAFYAGHYYSGKAPATSFLAVPVYWMVWHLSSHRLTLPDWAYLYLVRTAVISLPSVVMVLLLHAFLGRFGMSGYFTDLLVIGYGLGTMAFPYSTQFMGHQLAAFLLFSCFLVLLRWRRQGKKKACPLFMGGLFGGLAVAADYPAALILAIIFILMVFSLRRFRDIFTFAIGCLPGAFMVLLYNYACFGDPLSFPYAHEAMPIAREVQSQGFFGVRMPRLIPFLKLLLSPSRGLFYVSPFLLLAIPGLYSLSRPAPGDEELERAIGISRPKMFWLFLLIILAYLLFNSSYGAWSGGAAYGPRLLVPVIPFLMVPIAALMARKPHGYSWLLSILVLYSVAFHFIATCGGPRAHEHLRNPVREFLLPSVLKGNIRPNWFTLADSPAGLSLLFIIALMVGLLALFLATGRGRGAPPRPSRVTVMEKLLPWFCGIVAITMLCLFSLHKTDETAYKYAVIGYSFDFAGDCDEAARYFEKSLSLEPANPVALNELTRILVEKADYREALEINIRALVEDSAQPAVQIRCNSLMNMLDITGKIEASPQDPELYLKRADILEKMGYTEAARRDRQMANSLTQPAGIPPNPGK